MSFRFKPQDFVLFATTEQEYAAEKANRLLDEHVATLPEVLGSHAYDENGRDIGYIWTRDLKDNETHRTKLWDIEKIEPEKCDHLRITFGVGSMESVNSMTFDLSKMTCRDCGKRLIAKWEEAE